MSQDVKIPYNRQSVDPSDLEAISKVLFSDFLTTGPEVQAFENDLKAYTGAKHAAVCSNGTTALHLAYLGIGIQKGDVVIVPTHTFAATASAAVFCGAEVEFCDVDADSGNLTPETVEAALSRLKKAGKKPKAIAAVHFGGASVDLEGLSELARRHSILLVEDSAHALGAMDANGNRIGSCKFSAASTFSFHPIKTITTAEGGAVTSSDPKIHDRILKFRNHGVIKDPALWVNPPNEVEPWYYEIQEIGSNYRLPDILCALGRNQLKRVESFVSKRAARVAQYQTEIEKRFKDGVRPLRSPTHGKSSYHLFVVRMDWAKFNTTRSRVVTGMAKAGISTQVNYLPVHKMPYYQDRNASGLVELPAAEALSKSCLSLPLYSDLTSQQVTEVLDQLQSLLEN